jgi:hypothetical protein
VALVRTAGDPMTAVVCECRPPGQISSKGMCPNCGFEGPNYRAALEAQRVSQNGNPEVRAADADRKHREVYGDAPHPADDAAEMVRHQGSVPQTPVISWEDPVPLTGSAARPDFPVEVLPDWCREMAEAVAEETQVPVDLPACLVLGTLSTAAGRKVVVVVRGGWAEPVNLYLVPALPSGGRKSGTFALMMAPVYAAERKLIEKADKTIAEAMVRRAVADEKAEQALKDAKKSGKGEDEDDAVRLALEAKAIIIPAVPQLIAEDVTPEEAASILADQGGRLAILAPEGDFFNLILGLYGGTPKLALFKKGHSGDPLKVNRRERKEYVQRPALTLCVSPQPGVLAVLAEQQRMREEGALARPLYAVPQDLIGKRKIITAPIPEAVASEYAANVESLISSMAGRDGDNPYELKFDQDADRALLRFQERTERRLASGGDMEALRDWGGKLAGAAVRIAALLHIAAHLKDGWGSPVSGTTMKSAIKIAEYFSSHAFIAFGIMHADPLTNDAAAVLEWLRRIDWSGETGGKLGQDIAAHAGVITRREVQTGNRCIQTADHAAAVMRLLEKAGYVRAEPFAPTPRWRLHPSLTPVAASAAPDASAASAGADFSDVSADHTMNGAADTVVCNASAAVCSEGGLQTLQTAADAQRLQPETGVDLQGGPVERPLQTLQTLSGLQTPIPGRVDAQTAADDWPADPPDDDGDPWTATQTDMEASPWTPAGDPKPPARQQPRHQTRSQRHGKGH